MSTVLYCPSFRPAPPIPGLWWNPYEPMPRQAAEWTCSACSLAWVERSTGVNEYADEWSAVNEIGQPNNINATWGLMDGSGTQIERVYRSYGLDVERAYMNFDTLYEKLQTKTGSMGGAAWYHWVALRGADDGIIYIANSAPGYKGIYSTLTRSEFNALGGFACVLVSR